MPIRERIRALVWFRLEAVTGLEEALRRALAIRPCRRTCPRALKQGWSSADTMWRLAGDTATDYNHYTKRAILGRDLRRDAGGVRGRRERGQGRDRAPSSTAGSKA